MINGDKIVKASIGHNHCWSRDPASTAYEAGFFNGARWAEVELGYEIGKLQLIARNGLDFIAQCKDQNTILPGEVDGFEEALKEILSNEEEQK